MARAPIRVGDRVRFTRDVVGRGGRVYPPGAEAVVYGLGPDARFGHVVIQMVDPYLPARFMTTVPPALDPAAVAVDDPDRTA